MKKAGPVTQEKQSYIFTYTFEDQEFKLKEGKRATIANNLFLIKRLCWNNNRA